VANLGVQYVVWLMGQHPENPDCHIYAELKCMSDDMLDLLSTIWFV
jgi:hypothetical protein